MSTQYRAGTTCSLAIVRDDGETSSARSVIASVERLQMAPDSYHVPVLEHEIVELFRGFASGVIIDATLGGGGHSASLLRSLENIRVLGIDRDPEARAKASEVLAPYAPRFAVVDATFADLADVLERNATFVASEPVIGVLMDLGVSSHQLDESRRGFSFRADAPLDMRMDPTRGFTAAAYLETIDAPTLARLLRENGEGRFAGAIARSVVASHPRTTGELVDAVERAVPAAARRRGHVATRVFQALRIVVNDEVHQLEAGLRAAFAALAPGGLLVVISYHSGEDRVVKSYLHELATGGCTCPTHLPCVCGAVPSAHVFKASAQLASADEIARNPRARSARLRIARKVVP